MERPEDCSILCTLTIFLQLTLRKAPVTPSLSLWERVGDEEDSIANNPLFQALEHVHAPQTCCAWFRIYIAVLQKFLAIHIIAQGKAAVETEGIVIFQDVAAECCIIPGVPYSQDIVICQAAEAFRAHCLFDPTDITAVAVPQKIAGVNPAVH
jgi:hypothetical protein